MLAPRPLAFLSLGLGLPNTSIGPLPFHKLFLLTQHVDLRYQQACSHLLTSGPTPRHLGGISRDLLNIALNPQKHFPFNLHTLFKNHSTTSPLYHIIPFLHHTNIQQTELTILEHCQTPNKIPCNCNEILPELPSHSRIHLVQSHPSF